MTFRPMKGAAFEPHVKLRFPKLASYKINGIRAVWFEREFFSSKLITLPNRGLQALGARFLGASNAGWDGELAWGAPNDADVYNTTVRSVMSVYAPAHKLRFFVFDHAEANFNNYADRVAAIEDRFPFAIKLDQFILNNDDELQASYSAALALGYEGLVLRDPLGPYKHGRSTLREQYMVKLKPHLDAEAPVIGFEELEHNLNDPELNALGLTKRSSAKDGKIPGNTLGALIVDWDGSPLRIGTFKGFTKSELQKIWDARVSYFGVLAKFKYFMIGSQGLPLHPRLIGWRSAID